MTITDRFDPRDNGITPLRLILALLVVFSHSWPAGGFGFDPLFQVTGGQMQIGTLSVIAFFGLSGFLLTSTRADRSRRSFAWHRFLRVAPGLATCLVLTVLVVAPAAAALGGTGCVPDLGPWPQSVLTLQPRLANVPGMYPGVGWGDVVNASLWTIGIEIWCYTFLWALPVRALLPGLAVVGTAMLVASADVNGAELALHLPIAFATGGILARWSRGIPMHGGIAGGLVAATAASAFTGHLALLAPATLPYVAVWVGIVVPLRWTADLSYGVYIYAWPVQAMLAVAGVASLGVASYLIVAIGPILCLAWISWRFIERPSMQWRTTPARLQARASWSVTR